MNKLFGNIERGHPSCRSTFAIHTTFARPKIAKELLPQLHGGQPIGMSQKEKCTGIQQTLKIHRLTELFAEVCEIRYYPNIYRCPAYGF